MVSLAFVDCPLEIFFGMEAALKNSFDLSTWSPELRRALISIRPDFFGLSPEQQLLLRMNLPVADRQAIVAALLAAHGHDQSLELAEKESTGRLETSVQHRINEWLQPLIGIGEDAFSFNESFRPDRALLDFRTLLDYDRDDHEYQELARKELDPAYAPRPYAGALNWTWARCMFDGRLCYLTLSMAATHLIHCIENAAFIEVDRLILNRYVPRPDNGQAEKGFIRWSHRVEAGGQEALLGELQQRIWAYLAARQTDLQVEFNSQSRASTYLSDSSDPESTVEEQNLTIVFSDPRALVRVRLTSFLRDCRLMECPLDELACVERREADRVIQFVNEQHQELLRTFDTSVVPLRRRTKVLIHPGAFDALNGSEDR